METRESMVLCLCKNIQTTRYSVYIVNIMSIKYKYCNLCINGLNIFSSVKNAVLLNENHLTAVYNINSFSALYIFSKGFNFM